MNHNSSSFEDDHFFDGGEDEAYLLDDEEPADPSFSAGLSRSKAGKTALGLCLVAIAVGGVFYAYENSDRLFSYSSNQKKPTFTDTVQSSAVEPRVLSKGVNKSSIAPVESVTQSPKSEKTVKVETPLLDQEIAAQSDTILTPFPDSDMQALINEAALPSLNVVDAQNSVVVADSQHNASTNINRKVPTNIQDQESPDLAIASLPDTTDNPDVDAASAESALASGNIETDVEEVQTREYSSASTEVVQDAIVLDMVSSKEAAIKVEAPAVQPLDVQVSDADEAIGESIAEAIEKIEPVASADLFTQQYEMSEGDAEKAQYTKPIKKSALPATAVHALHQKPEISNSSEIAFNEKQAVAPSDDQHMGIVEERLWQISGAQPGKAVLKNLKSGELISVETGNIVRGLGTIKSVGRINGQWVVKGSKAELKR